MDKKTASTGLLALSILSVAAATLDYLADVPVLNLGADSWMLVGIAFGVYALAAKQWS